MVDDKTFQVRFNLRELGDEETERHLDLDRYQSESLLNDDAFEWSMEWKCFDNDPVDWFLFDYGLSYFE